jgi:hypothetical protein
MKPFIRKMPPDFCPGILTNRWQSYIPGDVVHGQFQQHPTHAAAVARLVAYATRAENVPMGELQDYFVAVLEHSS